MAVVRESLGRATALELGDVRVERGRLADHAEDRGGAGQALGPEGDEPGDDLPRVLGGVPVAGIAF